MMLENFFSRNDVSDFKIWMEWADRYVIITHMSPDGDAIGSSLALCQFLINKGKSVSVIVPDCPPDFLNWLPGSENIISHKNETQIAEELMHKADVICCLDFNVISRIGDMASAFLFSKAKKIMIDHHPSPGTNWDVILSHTEASSTSELIFYFLCALGEYENITLEIAECMYTGMMTDTGAFTYNSNNPQIFTIISHLLDKGVDKDEIYRQVYHNYSESRIRLMGFILNKKMEVFPKMSTALITLTDKEMKKYNYENGDSEGFVNLPLQIKGIKFSVFLREDTENRIIKVSLRSVGDIPCNIFASENFGGGGHKNASGGEFHDTLELAVEKFHEGMKRWSKSDEECIRQLFIK
jgi:bifunctional oligoribonuclease and PAP phosphatase NrnA